MIKESVQLYYREGGSDKVYNVALVEEKNGLCNVQYAYGRRGSSLNTGNKNTSPLPYNAALKVYNKLVLEKTGKGYTEDKSGKAFTSSIVTSSVDTGMRPQLLNDIDEKEVAKYLKDDHYCAQEKFDGRRRLLKKAGGEVIAANKKGLSIPVDTVLESILNKFPDKTTLDGEDMGDYIVVFDSLELPKLPYRKRFQHVSLTVNAYCNSDVLRVPRTEFTEEGKSQLFLDLMAENAEGIVFKEINAPYTPGKPNSGGTQLKFKFYASSSCVVIGVSSSKRSVELGVYSNKMMIPVGNVTVYPNQEIPVKGSVVEVRYLYYYPGGALYQPVLLGVRDDQYPIDCVVEKLKPKKEELD